MNTFDPSTHSYSIDGRPVPSVTQVLNTVLGGAIWQASEWHMDRGTAVHACAALIAQGKSFEHDPAIDGQVRACRKFFADMKPEALEVERQVYNTVYQYAGTYDLLSRIQGKICLIDWKSSASPVAEIQLGAYSLAGEGAVRWGMIVELREDGNYRTGGMIKLERYRQEFLACLSVYAIRQRFGLIKSKEDAE